MQLLSHFFWKRSADNTDDKMKQLAKLSGARLQQAEVIPSSDNTAVRNLIDLWHFFARISVQKTWRYQSLCSRLLQCAKLGMTWEEAVRSPVWNKKLWAFVDGSLRQAFSSLSSRRGKDRRGEPDVGARDEGRGTRHKSGDVLGTSQERRRRGTRARM
ncbi:BQ5605_C041g11948 [Microbotryum silenes-dioicae]|uniref:BQ5605_C041g11948 protein n=1 Tax=Microbotryum silenes-dioicae TaxID=796604 RepID=A0A2X0MTR4_9BASI|nr:BQ5605_C041g11948 [Microbotryum silenes-dioicae]